MIISLSISALCAEIQATSAMYAILSGTPDAAPACLHRDHEAALRCLLRSAFTDVCAALIAHVDDIDTDADSDMLSVHLRLPEGFPSASVRPLRLLLEHAVSSRALAAAYLNFDASLSATNSRVATDTVRRVATLLDPFDPAVELRLYP